METAVLTSIVAAISALLGVALSARAQLRVQYSNQEFQHHMERSKREFERTETDRSLALKRLTKIHCLLSTIGREFSITNLDIIWRSEMPEAEYDQKYLAICQEVDELRALTALYEPFIAGDVEKIYGQMNVFWGNFKSVLRLTRLGEKVDHTTPCFCKAHDAIREIGKMAYALKGDVSHLSEKYRSG